MKKITIFLALFLSLVSIAYSANPFDFYDTCSTGTGRSSNIYSPYCMADQRVDCCIEHMTYHVHDMGEMVSKDTVESLNVSLMFGLPTPVCSTKGEIYVSQSGDVADPSAWTLLGYTDETVGGNNIHLSFNSIPTDFRYVLIGDYNERCYVDFSDAGVMLKDGDEVPEFSTAAGVIAALGAIGAIVIVKRRH